MIAAPGSAVWFAHHESRLAWRDWLAMMTAGRRERLPRVVVAIAVFFIFMHFVAYWTVGRYASALPDKPTLVAISTSVLLSWLLMISQAMESITRAFYSRSDLDLILASPAARRVDEMVMYSAVGTPPAVREYLEGFARHAQADELITVHQSPAADDRLRSVELLAGAMAVEGDRVP